MDIKHCKYVIKLFNKYDAGCSRVVSMLDSGAEGPGFKSQPQLSGNSLRQTVHTHCACVHQAAKTGSRKG